MNLSYSKSFLWYDYETSGRHPRRCRPVQFAGVRTDENLEELGEPHVWYCRTAPDRLPGPGAAMVHGFGPSRLQSGLSEAEFAERVHAALSPPGTCSVGYNAIRFDHEYTRFLFYRNLLDPYAWHWKDGNTRWDLIDLFRAAYALRPEGIQWPVRKDEENEGAERPSFRLQDLAAANGIGGHGAAHEALADVRTMIDLARLARDCQPKLFEWALRIRDKNVAAAVMRGADSLAGRERGANRDRFVWVASIFQRSGCVAPVFRIGSRPDNPNAVIAFDLSRDPAGFAGLSAEALRDKLFSPGERSPVFVVKANRCPFVAPYSVLTDEALDRLRLDRDTLEARYRLLRDDAALRKNVLAAYAQPPRPDRVREALDVDEALYAGFMPDRDRNMLARLRAADPNFARVSQDQLDQFEDVRIRELVFRYRARNFPDSLGAAERRRWRDHCRERHLTRGEDGRTALDAYHAEIKELRKTHRDAPDKAAALDDLEGYGRWLAAWLDGKEHSFFNWLFRALHSAYRFARRLLFRLLHSARRLARRRP